MRRASAALAAIGIIGGGLQAAVAADASSDKPAIAARPEGCGAFSWPVAREQAWFGDDHLARRASGARLARIDRAVQLSLAPTAHARFFLAPQRAADRSGYGGVAVFLGVPKPAVYQVTVSEQAAIDVFENGARLKPIASTGAPGCAGVRRSARYRLAPGDLVLVEVSGAADPSIKLAFAAAQ